MSPDLIVTPGDPAGIGPEVLCMALREPQWRSQIRVLGDLDALDAAASHLGVSLRGVDRAWPDAGDEPVEVRAIRQAVREIQAGSAHALVTGPIHKGRLVAQGFGFSGHTDFLAHLLNADPVMTFVGGKLRVALATVHIPLSQVPAALTSERILHTVRTAAAALHRDLGIERPKILLCGLNPHAGDQGVLGREEIHTIEPAADQLRAEGLDVVGPMSAEAAFYQHAQGIGDLVVAMYHDQGLVPLKMMDFGRSVNWSAGLPIPRTSVDHGTADSLVGTGTANPGSMLAALRLARQLADARATRLG